jgi:hypothetical protein
MHAVHFCTAATISLDAAVILTVFRVLSFCLFSSIFRFRGFYPCGIRLPNGL